MRAARRTSTSRSTTASSGRRHPLGVISAHAHGLVGLERHVGRIRTRSLHARPAPQVLAARDHATCRVGLRRVGGPERVRLQLARELREPRVDFAGLQPALALPEFLRVLPVLRLPPPHFDRRHAPSMRADDGDELDPGSRGASGTPLALAPSASSSARAELVSSGASSFARLVPGEAAAPSGELAPPANSAPSPASRRRSSATPSANTTSAARTPKVRSCFESSAMVTKAPPSVGACRRTKSRPHAADNAGSAVYPDWPGSPRIRHVVTPLASFPDRA